MYAQLSICITVSDGVPAISSWLLQQQKNFAKRANVQENNNNNENKEKKLEKKNRRSGIKTAV